MIEGIRANSRTTFRKLAALIAAAAFATTVGIQSGFAADGVNPVRTTIDTTRLSPDLVSLGKLIQTGVDEAVVLKFIENSPPKRNPTAEELVYLHELGLSSEGMVVLLNAAPKVSLTQSGTVAAVATSAQPAPVQETAPAPQPAPVTTTQTTSPTPANTVISSPPPTVIYQPAPTTVYVQRPPVVQYVDPYPRFSFGINLGHVWGHHHHQGYWGHGGHWGHRGRHH